MAASGWRTIIIQAENEGSGTILEKLAGEAGIKPGHLLAISSGALIKHATADGITQRFTAIESPTASNGTALTIDVAYASGDTVYYTQPEAGDVLYMFLATANSATAGVTPLGSNGDGTLKVVTVAAGTLDDSVVGYAEDTLNNTSGSAARLRVRIR